MWRLLSIGYALAAVKRERKADLDLYPPEMGPLDLQRSAQSLDPRRDIGQATVIAASRARQLPANDPADHSWLSVAVVGDRQPKRALAVAERHDGPPRPCVHGR